MQAVNVRYVIPEDGDDLSHPNVFQVGSTGDVILSTVRRAFPVPGTYHFRFLHALAGGEKVWLDVVDDNATVPKAEDGIIAKVSRVGGSASSFPAQNASPAKMNVGQPYSSTATEKLLNFDSDSGSLSPVGVKSAGARAATASSTSSSSSSSSSTSEINLASASDDLIGFKETADPVVVSNSSSRNSSNIDLFGLDSLQPVMAPPPQQSPRPPPMSAMGGMVRPAPSNGGFGDPFSVLGQPKAPTNPYQSQQQRR